MKLNLPSEDIIERMEREMFREIPTENLVADMIVSWFTNRHFWGYFELVGRAIPATAETIVNTSNLLVDTSGSAGRAVIREMFS